MRRHELTDAQWNLIKAYLPGKRSDPGRTAKDNRRFVDGVLWLARTGAPWRDLPERYGRWNPAFQRYSRWSKRGVWQQVLESLGGDVDLEHLLLDSTTVRAHQHAAGAKRGETAQHSAAPGVDGARRSRPR
jgi:transposase